MACFGLWSLKGYFLHVSPPKRSINDSYTKTYVVKGFNRTENERPIIKTIKKHMLKPLLVDYIQKRTTDIWSKDIYSVIYCSFLINGWHATFECYDDWTAGSMLSCF